ncbi:MAG: hypothetical protein MUF15_25650 [Acidobacteria bacterium]|nr:hypothetical protein [Acidobacteriota bacterium]
MKAWIILMIMMGFLCSTGFAQKKETVEELSNRVKILEGQKEYLDKQNTLQKEDLEKQSEYLKKEFEVQTKELYRITEQIKSDQRKNNWLFYSLPGIFIFIGFGGFWRIKKYINKKTQELAEKIINDVLPKKEKEFLALVEKQSEEFKLKEEKSILVISKTENNIAFMKKFFKERGFVKVNYSSIDKARELNHFDLILFNNETEKKVKEPDHSSEFDIVKKTKENVICFYFGPNRFELDEYKNKLNFANSRVQLYGNLINSLRYQSLLE